MLSMVFVACRYREQDSDYWRGAGHHGLLPLMVGNSQTQGEADCFLDTRFARFLFNAPVDVFPSVLL